MIITPERLGFKDGMISQTIPWVPSGYIDGMFHVAMLVGASDDAEIRIAGVSWLNMLARMGPDARNFYHTSLENQYPWLREWELRGEYRVKVASQSFAGPAALCWAQRRGLLKDYNVRRSYSGVKLLCKGYNVDSPYSKAKFLCYCAWAFGYIVRWMPALKQHINTMFLAHLLMEECPPSSMKWLAYDNPFYLYLYGEKHKTEWPVMSKYSEGNRVDTKSPSKFCERAPGSWVAKNYCMTQYLKIGEVYPSAFTPVCQYVVSCLQDSL